MALGLRVELDGPQQRLKEDMLSMLVGGFDWIAPTLSGIGAASSACWIEPVKHTAMLMPGPVNPDWTKSTVGVCAKYRLSDFSGLTDAGNWTEQNHDAGGPFIQYRASGGNPGFLSGRLPTQPVNQGICVELFATAFPNGNPVLLECGWSNTGDGSVGVSLRIYSGGTVEVWKDAVLLGTYSISFTPDHDAWQRPLINGSPVRTVLGFSTIMLLPFRDRELLVHSSYGGAFVHTFADLDEGVGGQTITLGEAFWFTVPAPSTPDFRFAQIKFAPSGSLVSRTTAWRVDPPVDGGGSDLPPNISVYQSLSQAPAHLVAANVEVATNNPHGIAKPRHVKVDLTRGTGGYAGQSPFLYGVRAWYPPTMATTRAESDAHPDEGVDITDHVVSASMQVSDSIAGSSWRVTIANPGDLEVKLPYLRSQCARTAEVFDETGSIVQGTTLPPVWVNGFSEEVQDLELQIRDDWKFAEDYTFSESIPLDQLSLKDAYELIVAAIGCSSNVSAAAATVILGNSGTAAAGKWELCIRPGDRASTWLERLHSTYAGNYAHFMNRDNEFCLLAPSDMPSVASATLYGTEDAAIAALVAGGMSEEDAGAVAYKHVYRKIHRTRLEPEANEVWVTGRDARTLLPIVRGRRDQDSADPTLRPSSRPANWLGYLKKAAFGDDSLTTKTLVQGALDILFTKLTAERELYDFECEYLDGLWKGDLVLLKEADEDGADVLVRIKTFQGTFQQVAEGWVWRPFTYVGEAGDLVCPIGVPGKTGSEIEAAWKRKPSAVYYSLFDMIGTALADMPQFSSWERV